MLFPYHRDRACQLVLVYARLVEPLETEYTRGYPPLSRIAPNRSTRWGILLGCALTIVVVGHLHFANITFDDAFISFRYAENLATGRGLVFNVGERVEGYSNFLWTVLFAVPVWLHVDRYELGLLVTAKVLGVLLSIGTLLIVTRTASLGRSPEQRTAPLAALYLASLAPFSIWGIGGLETPLVTLLIALAVHLHLCEDATLCAGRPRIAWSYVALLLAAITRPEPVVLIVPLAAARLAREYLCAGRARFKRALLELGLFALPYATFLAFRYGYYGQFVPNTYFAKLGGDESAVLRGSRYVAAASDHMNWLCLLVVCGSFILLARRLSYRLGVVLLLTALQIAVVLYEGGDWMPGCRLLVPSLPLIALLVSEAWRAIGLISRADLAPTGGAPSWLIRPEWLAAWQTAVRNSAKQRWNMLLGRGLRVTAYAALAMGCLASSVGSFDTIPMRAELSGLHGLQLSHSRYFGIARWMQHGLPGPGLLAIGEAGVIPYYTKLPILDLHGLMDPYVARLPGAMHRKYDGDYVFRRKPRYVFLLVRRAADGKLSSDHVYAQGLLEDPRFSERYGPLRDFGFAILYAEKSALNTQG